MAELTHSSRTLFHAAHYNALAKEIRERLEVALNFNNNYDQVKMWDRSGRYYATEALVVLALSLCKRFKEDNPRFDPVKFLDACSPDLDLYPLAELYEGDNAD